MPLPPAAAAADVACLTSPLQLNDDKHRKLDQILDTTQFLQKILGNGGCSAAASCSRTARCSSFQRAALPKQSQPLPAYLRGHLLTCCWPPPSPLLPGECSGGAPGGREVSQGEWVGGWVGEWGPPAVPCLCSACPPVQQPCLPAPHARWSFRTPPHAHPPCPQATAHPAHNPCTDPHHQPHLLAPRAGRARRRGVPARRGLGRQGEAAAGGVRLELDGCRGGVNLLRTGRPPAAASSPPPSPTATPLCLAVDGRWWSTRNTLFSSTRRAAWSGGCCRRAPPSWPSWRPC